MLEWTNPGNPEPRYWVSPARHPPSSRWASLCRAVGGGCLRRRYLLNFYARAGLFELALELVGLLALDALLDGLRRLVHERLGLLEAEAGRGADDLDDLDLLVAGCGEDDVDGARLLLLGGAAIAGGSRGSGGGDRGRRDAQPLLERPDALGELEHGDALELLDPVLGGGGHVLILLGSRFGDLRPTPKRPPRCRSRKWWCRQRPRPREPEPPRSRSRQAPPRRRPPRPERPLRP